ncbi:hypothetical protein [Aquimarina sp. AU474]|uniref:hypothetical protein n=1 Tax=Aquimarina sp. AU474 TaxID=2108529 RepID=UPI000D68B767|nr:hypothetical protein [Aquimarina sp. AU474]
MGSTITQNNGADTTEDFVNSREKWCKENILKLAHHFHEWDKNSEQFRRVNFFSLNDKDAERFSNIKKIREIRICLALRGDDINKITFYPYLQVNGSKDLVFYFIPQVKKLDAEIVPETFKKMIGDNWNDIDMHLIDDLFHCKTNEGKGPVERVLSYYIGNKDETDKRILQYINDVLLDKVTGVNLYPGVDMNKFSKKEMISFTPVLGFNTAGVTMNNELGLRGVVESISGPDETLVEYLSPCPPTC